MPPKLSNIIVHVLLDSTSSRGRKGSLSIQPPEPTHVLENTLEG